ncbi:MAG TPA: BMC domain-containing protein [bacterium]|nr:BMC domain-containing protein [bacterium]
MQEALGVVETIGFATAMEAADAAVKAANVKLGEYLKVGGGKVNIILRGDVAAVKAAVEAAVAAASQVGQVVGQAVIPRPADKLSPIFPIDVVKKSATK